MSAPLRVEEITDLAGMQALLRALVIAAFHERLPDVDVATVFHRGWNGGWRCRATASSRPPLDFALVRHGSELIALPVPMPHGWRRRGVAGSAGGRFGVAEGGEIIRLG